MNKNSIYAFNSSGRRGMMFPLLLLAVIIIVGLGYAFHQYRVAQISMTDEIARFYAATCAAEAGISCAIAELRGGSTSWKTHQTKLDAQGNVVWDAPLPHVNVVQPSGTLVAYSTVTGSSGTVYGKLGSPVSLGEFRVRCGHAITKDNKDTKAVNEGNMFFKIESIGKYLDTHVRITSIVEARDLSEFLMYDGDFLDMVLGLPGTKLPDASNFFSIGTLYGRRGVYLGTIFGNGNPPVLKLENMSDISTGTTGEIYVFDPYVTLNGKQLGRNDNSSKINFGPAQGTGAKTVTGGTWNADFAKNNVGAKQVNGAWTGGILKDGRHGGRDLPIINSKAFTQKYKHLAKNGGIYVASPGANLGEANNGRFEFKNPYPGVDISNMRYVDFGASISEQAKAETAGAKRANLSLFAGMEREGNIKDATIAAKLKDPAFNGVIYAEVPLRIRGNPPRDLVIASDKDIYICGDLNQATDVMQNYKDDKFLEYAANPATGLDYWDEDSNWRKANAAAGTTKGMYRHRLTVFSNAKIWYDYTRPDMVFENELMPYIEWKLAAGLATQPDASGAFGAACMMDIYDNTFVVRYKKNGGKVDVSNIADYDLAGKSGSILDAIKTNANKWANVDAFVNDAGNAAFLKMLDDDFFKGAGNSMDAKKFIKDTATTKLKVKDATDPTKPPADKDFIDLLKISPGKLDAAARAALARTLLDAISDAKPDCLWGASTSLPWKLFDKVGLVAGASPAERPFCQFLNPPKDFATDRLYLPEITMNARMISSDARLPGTIWDIGNTSNAIYNELGNRPRKSDAGYDEYMPNVSSILRVMGSEIFLRENKVPPDMTGNVYRPNMRKKIYDAALTNFEDPQGLTNYGLATWVLQKSAKVDYEAF